MATMMPKTIARPNEALELGVNQVGGKAFGLAKLEQIGIRVPAWVVLTSACWTITSKARIWSRPFSRFFRLWNDWIPMQLKPDHQTPGSPQ